ncbi:MAG: L,D-transpeptidase [Anaerolineae bacterium]|nr:L,D-transpeptidase [Anaerolineae bacterium]
MRNRGITLILIGVLLSQLTLFTGPAHAQNTLEYDPLVCTNDNAGKPLSPACADMIKAFPRPDVQEIKQDKQTLSAYSFWRVGPEPTNTYDQPNGAVTGQIPKGFNFVRAIDQSVDGWIQIQGGKWVNKADAKESSPSYFVGVTFPKGYKYPFAFVLDKSHIFVSEHPGGPASSKTGRFLKRYERVNLYAKAKDSEGKDWYMIGPNQWVKQTFLAVVEKIDKPKDVSGYWIAVDLYEQTLVAYEDETPVFATLVSSGLPTHDTREGTFKIWARLDHDGMSGATGAPSAYALQFVPWVMYFDDSISLHGTYWHDLFGYRQSHGCVNLTISDARYVFEWTGKAPQDEKGQPTIYVYVHSTGKYGSGVIRQ